MAEILVSIQAYCKILLHAVKHPHCAVNGVLLAEDGKSKDRKTVKFVDCIPLFHLTLSLSPMLEAALLQVFFPRLYVVPIYVTNISLSSFKGINCSFHEKLFCGFFLKICFKIEARKFEFTNTVPVMFPHG